MYNMNWNLNAKQLNIQSDAWLWKFEQKYFVQKNLNEINEKINKILKELICIMAQKYRMYTLNWYIKNNMCNIYSE